MSRRVFDFESAIARAPAPNVVDGLRVGGEAPTYAGVLAEHEAYVAALEAAGVAGGGAGAARRLSGFGVRRGPGLRPPRRRDPAAARRAQPVGRGRRDRARAARRFARVLERTRAMPTAATC